MRSKLLVSAVVASALAGGATLGVTGIAGAQTNDDRPAAEADGPRHGPKLDAAAQALNLSVDDLRSKLEGGQTLAQVAQQQGVDAQTVIDAMVADATAHIDQPKGEHGPKLDAAAKALNVSVDDLRSKLHDGKTLADVAKEQNVDVSKVIDAMVADATAHIDQAVQDGKLTADQASERKSNLKDRITKLVNEGPSRDRGEDAPRDGNGPPPDSSNS